MSTEYIYRFNLISKGANILNLYLNPSLVVKGLFKYDSVHPKYS